MLETVNRPDFRDVDKEIFYYVQYLEKIIEGYRENGAVQFMAALNRQLKKIAVQIEEADIDFAKSEDRMYERFLNTAKLGKDLTADFKSFLQEYGEKIKEEEGHIPLIEKHARRK